MAAAGRIILIAMMNHIETFSTPSHDQVARIGYARDSKGRGYLLFDQREHGVLVQVDRDRDEFTRLCEDATQGKKVLSTWWYPIKKGESLVAWPNTPAEIRKALAWANKREPAAAAAVTPPENSPSPITRAKRGKLRALFDLQF